MASEMLAWHILANAREQELATAPLIVAVCRRLRFDISRPPAGIEGQAARRSSRANKKGGLAGRLSQNRKSNLLSGVFVLILMRFRLSLLGFLSGVFVQILIRFRLSLLGFRFGVGRRL
jgi:hypothetical protein